MLADICILGLAILGLLYCIFEWRLVTRIQVNMSKNKDTKHGALSRGSGAPGGSMDRVLLNHYGSRGQNVKKMGDLIANGADSFLMAEYRYLFSFAVLFAVLISVLINIATAGAFVVGCAAAVLAGYIGLKVATRVNYLTTYECWNKKLDDGYNLAMRGGFISSVALVSIGLLSLLTVVASFKAIGGWTGNSMWVAVSGYSFGVSSIGLFTRVGGGIFTKAADIGADISGKSDFGLMEDDYRNPACIADNVGDNVGGVVGIGADLLGSYAGSTCAALVIAGSSVSLSCESGPLDEVIGKDPDAMLFPVLVTVTGMVAGIITKPFRCTPVTKSRDVSLALKRLIVFSTFVQSVLVLGLSYVCLPPTFAITCRHDRVRPIHCAVCVWLGQWSGVIVAQFTEYYTSYKNKPVMEIANAQVVSAATGVILGLAVGYISCAAPVIVLALTILFADILVGSYGVALAALGMISIMTVTLAMEAYDAIADNASGIAEMSGLSTDVREITDVLGGAGAIGNGFAMSAAALVSLSLCRAFQSHAEVEGIDSSGRWYFTGLLIGAMLPYCFSAITMKAVGKAANEMVAECRVQFTGIIQHDDDPDYDRCIQISTNASLTKMVPAGVLVMGSPVIVGLVFGKKCTLGLLQGMLVSSVQMGISMMNTGGAWDNAKKYVEMNHVKGSEQHKNAVIGDIIGDPLKDVSGPSMNVLVNLGTITSLVCGTMISRWSTPDGNPFWWNLI